MTNDYAGSCHCGRVTFEAEFSSGLGEIRRCNCSLCRKKGALMASLPMQQLRLVSGSEFLSVYQWNRKIAKHYFCKVCGIYTHHQRRSVPEEYAVNVACLEGVEIPDESQIVMLDGASNDLVDVDP